jgi:hypothetical protein
MGETDRRLGFDPRQSTVIRRPTGNETGHGFWVGAPAVFYDRESELFYLTYRYHNHYEAEVSRCHSVRIAVSGDGVRFEDLKEFRKEEFDSSALTRASLVKMEDGSFLYLMAHDSPDETRWTPGMIAARKIEELEASNWQPLLPDGPASSLSLRDPYALSHAGVRHVLLVMERTVWPVPRDPGDPYRGATCVRSTGLADMGEGVRFEWKGEVLPVSRDGWDRTTRRVSSMHFDQETSQFLGYYDGGSVNNHEDRCGIVAGPDLSRLTSLSPHGPFLSAPWPYGSGALCCVDTVVARGKRYVYFETGMENGGHELRVAVQDVERAGNAA